MEMIRLSSLEQYYQLPRNKWNIKQLPAEEKGESIFDRGKLSVQHLAQLLHYFKK